MPRRKRLPPDPENKNGERSDWAQAAISAFEEMTGSEECNQVSDLICDIMHWCDRNGQDFDNELRRARTHYQEETSV